MSAANDWGDAIAEEAKLWPGHWFRQGQAAQCMNWVREVLHRVGHPYANQATSQPVDGMSPGLGFANSLAGRDMGQLVTKIDQLEPGDIITWDNTYGNWRAGTITHVGIYVGDGEFVHRPTSSRPVERASLSGFWREKFRCGLRVPQERDVSPDAPTEKPKKKILQIVAHSGKLRANLGDGWIDLDSLQIDADYR